ncbi:TetR/AcrR family transcriptional regulator [Saccharopolyspora taberi]
MDHREQVLDAAGALFYERGIQAVGMAEIRTAAGVSLKRLYQCFASKDELVESYLRRRDRRWREQLAGHVAGNPGVLSVFDWLRDWFADPGFRGCAFINSFGELGATSDAVARAAREHKAALREFLLDQLTGDDREKRADQLLMLVDGAITTAAITGDPGAADTARDAARTLITKPPNSLSSVT